VKLSRDLSGWELVRALARQGYRVIRQTGSHVRLTSNLKENGHHITIPSHKPLKIGTFNSILNEVGSYLE
jgi:predicted RNA binding protein YcfA (HicA-like mRNA interferase family)